MSGPTLRPKQMTAPKAGGMYDPNLAVWLYLMILGILFAFSKSWQTVWQLIATGATQKVTTTAGSAASGTAASTGPGGGSGIKAT